MVWKNAAAAQQERDSLRRQVEQNALAMTSLQGQVSTFRDEWQKANTKVAQLQEESSLLLHANSFVEKIRRQLSYRSVDRDAIQDGLDEFDTARRAILRAKSESPQ